VVTRSIQVENATQATSPTAPKLSVPQGAAISIGAVLGTGVIALPALAAGIAGPASLIAWLALIILSIPIAVAFAALGARHPDSGGVSTYVRRAFGPRRSAAVGWCFYFAVPVGAPPAALFGGAYVAAAFGGGRAVEFAVAAAMIVAVTMSSAGGVRVSGKVQLGLAMLLAALLLAATVASLPHADLDNLRPFAPHGWLTIGPAMAVLVWAFAGWEAVTSLAGDFRDPERDVPRATAIAIVVVGVLYFGVAAASILVLGPHAGKTSAPLSELLAIGLGGPARDITAIAAVVMTLGTMNAYFAGSSKLGAALGRDGALPAWFARGNAAGQVPRRSLGVIAGLASAALVIVYFGLVSTKGAILLSTGSFTLVYVLGMAAALKLLPRRSWAWRGSIVAFVFVIALLVLTGVYVAWAFVVAGCSLLYAWRRRLTGGTDVGGTDVGGTGVGGTGVGGTGVGGADPEADRAVLGDGLREP
jgi:amino acid efflux transporter